MERIKAESDFELERMKRMSMFSYSKPIRSNFILLSEVMANGFPVDVSLVQLQYKAIDCKLPGYRIFPRNPLYGKKAKAG